MNTDDTTRYNAIMQSDNVNGYTNAELQAGWASPAVRRAAFEFAEDIGETGFLYQHQTYQEDGVPAIGFHTIAEQIAAVAAQRLEYTEVDAAIAGLIDTDDPEQPPFHPDVDALIAFIRDPYDNGPGFGNDLETIIEWSETTRREIERFMPQQWEEDDPRDDEYNAARDLTDALEDMEQFIRDEAESYATS